MAESRYERYIVREPRLPDDVSPYLGSGVIPLRFLEGTHGLIKEASTMLEYSWITKDRVMGHDSKRGPHKHNFDEIFLFMGINLEDPNDLGAEIEFWLGEREATDKLAFNTSSLVFVPGELVHMPIFFRNVKKPVLRMTIGLNVGEVKVVRYPPREL
jgi:hypothetical protein